MTQTLDNGIVVPVNSDAYNLTPDLATLGKKANVITNISSLAARTALNTTDVANRTIRRLDVGGSLEYWDGTQWISSLISTIWTATSGAISGGAAGSLGTLTLDAANSQNASFITTPAGSQLQVALAGVYAFHMHVAFSPNTAGWLAIKNQAGTGTYSLVNFPSGGEQSINIPNLYLAAATIVQFIVTPTTAQASGVSAVVRASKIG